MPDSQPEMDAQTRPKTPFCSSLDFPECLRGEWGVRVVINPDAWWLYRDDRERPVAEFGPLNREQAEAIAKVLNEAQR